MIDTSAMMAVPRLRRHERGCDPVTCAFTVARVRVYLICWRQAAIAHEAFEHVFGSSCRSSRPDAWNRGGGGDPFSALDIRIALEQARAAGLDLGSWNADVVAAWLCANDHQEPIIDDEDVERLF